MRIGVDWETREHDGIRAEWPMTYYSPLRTFCVIVDIPFLLPRPRYDSLCSHYPYGYHYMDVESEDVDQAGNGWTEREVELFASICRQAPDPPAQP